MNTHKIVFATGNQGKVLEIKEIMKDFLEKHNVELHSLKEEGIKADIVEDGKTFEENAIIKAKAIAELTDAIVMADDSGLEVDYLDKAPGIYSARFLGEDTSYDVKNTYILDKLTDVKGDDRSARFVCVIACSMPDGTSFTVRGTIEGIIADKISGDNGFGYDPIVYLPEYGKTSAQLDPEEKNKISHRGKALELIKKELDECL